MIVDMSRQTIRTIVTAPRMMQNVSRQTMRKRMVEIVIKTTTRRKVEVTWLIIRMEVIKLTPKMMVVTMTAPRMMVDMNRQAMRMIGTVTRED